ncbi:MAG TPA: LamG domain-containing protein, partial [Nakamurella sp.]
RIYNGSYQMGIYTNTPTTDPVISLQVPTTDLNTWVHLAASYDGTAWHLYRNGVLAGSTTNPTGAINVNGGWTIGNSLFGDRPFTGDLDEVRIWNIGRSAADIAAGMNTPLAGTEPSLVGVWRYNGQVMRDGTPARHDGTVTGLSVANPGPHPVYSVFATVGNQGAETVPWVPSGAWSHVAATFEQFYGVQVATGGYLDAGDAPALNLSRDLTIEAGIRIDDLSAPHGIITRGVLDDGTGDDVPYSLWVARDGSLVLGFEDKTHGVHTFSSIAGVLSPGVFRRVAVTRKHNVQVDTTNAGTKGGSAVVSAWNDITFYADGVQVGAVQRYDGPDVGSSEGVTLIGRAFGPGSAALGLRGALSEVRLWSAAREAPVIGAPLTGGEVGLVSWWRMQDGLGNVASDSKGRQDATLHGPVSWVHTPDGRGSSLTIYLDGVPVATTPLDPASLTPADQQFTLGALGNAKPVEFFTGQLEEMRVWRVTRTSQQVQDNLFGRLTGGFADLVAYYPFGAGAMVEDNGLRGNDLSLTGGGWVLSTAPIGEDTPLARNAVLGLRTRFDGLIDSSPAAAEYAALETDVSGATTGVLKRAYSFVDTAGSWRLVTGFKVGDLATQWVGQAQFDPQLIGYLEGAPPVPSENLTVQDSYTGSSSVALTEATTTTYTYGSTRDSGFNASFELAAGQGAQAQTFVGLLELEAPLGIGVGEIELTSAADVGVTFTAKANFETSLSWLDDTSSGQGSTHTQVSTLSLTGNKETTPAHPAVGARYVPNNTGFALVQSQTADVFALRLVHTGALVAYQMKPNPDIPKDFNIITFPIDPRYTKQGVLDGKVGGDVDADYPNALNYSPDLSYFKPIEAYGLKTQIQQQEEELSTLFAQHSVDPNQLSGGQLPEMPPTITRDVVNNYVWTADGGQFAETTSTLDTYSESVGGAYHFQGMAGGTLSADVSIFGFAVNFELSAMFGGHLDLSVTKTTDSQHSFEVDVTAGGEQDITVVDGTGQHVKAPGKVDAYRWLTFYLAPRADNYDAFYNRVVDPIWLAQSSDPSAIALRQARQDGKRPAAWRVLHRVTYVSRVLAPVGSVQQPLDQALASLNIASNYELIRTLEPFVRGRTGNYHDFVAAARTAVTTYLPDLLPHIDDILAFLVLYYGVSDAPQLAGALPVG